MPAVAFIFIFSQQHNYTLYFNINVWFASDNFYNTDLAVLEVKIILILEILSIKSKLACVQLFSTMTNICIK